MSNFIVTCLRSLLLLALCLAACSSPAATPAQAPEPTAAPPTGKRAPCTLGQDQTCNGDPKVSALWGRCTESGVCECNAGFELHPSGYCQPKP
jgi:hypothetical protein